MARIKLVGKYYQFRMRVPKRFAEVESKKEITASLKTDSELQAKISAAKLEEKLLAMWQARLAGENPDYQAILKYCQTLGYTYKSVDQQSDDEFVKRVSSVSVNDPEGFRALMGTVKGEDMRVSKMAEVYEEINAYQHTKKNSEQMRMWRNSFKRAGREFIEVCGDLWMREITQAEVIRFRDHFRDRALAGEILANSGNRSLGSMATMFNGINADRKMGLSNVFTGIRLRERKQEVKRRKALTNDMIAKILEPDALLKLNDEARDIVYICINTGCRPSEVCSVLVEHIHLNAKVPYFDLVEEGRELKTGASIRKVVLMGVALDAMKRRVKAGGFPRYRGKNNSMTTTINKFLHENRLLEKGYTFYGMRHAFEDRVTSQNYSDRIAAELMGHEVQRQRYGDGPDLALLAEKLKPISFF
ncbi:DUF6538 domain-containing protein [Epibacterium ulvae]|uniref:DUF6538 domain-containing protein n=1 Tax=Epibacterium ulvae TaxID=1156985 RepID=UPI00248FEDBA|nr:DUF6538 domain-containing protein [Epibacterium ulvae]